MAEILRLSDYRPRVQYGIYCDDGEQRFVDESEIEGMINGRCGLFVAAGESAVIIRAIVREWKYMIDEESFED